MAIVLGENRYGKAENRVFRVTRSGDRHEVLDLSVSVQLSGEFLDTHLTGDNSRVLPTDTMKNTVFALSHSYGAMEPEAFALVVARHFIAKIPYVSKAEVRIEKFAWERIISQNTPHPRAFRRDGSMTRTASAVVCRLETGTNEFVVCGLEDLVILKTSDSEFKEFLHDPFTTLTDATDRIMSTQVTARWRMTATDAAALNTIDWNKQFDCALDTLLSVFAQHHSLSLQQTLFAMGKRVLSEQPAIAAIRLSLPNKHHHLVDLSPFGQVNRNEVFIAADRPYGLIEAVIERDDASALNPTIPSWPAW